MWPCACSVPGFRGFPCSLSYCCLVDPVAMLCFGVWLVYCLSYSVAYEETQSNRVSDFRDLVCSLFPNEIHFYFY